MHYMSWHEMAVLLQEWEVWAALVTAVAVGVVVGFFASL